MAFDELNISLEICVVGMECQMGKKCLLFSLLYLLFSHMLII